MVMDMYSRYLEVFMVKSTSFEKLRPTLDEIWAQKGVPEKIIHDGGAPYTSYEWWKYS